MEFYAERLATVYQGDCRQMVEIADESIQCVTTSPPYWGLRKYEGNQDLIWGGNKDCEHEWAGDGLVSDRRGVEIVQGKTRTTTRYYGNSKTRTWSEEHQKHYQDTFCLKCGAWEGAFGLEPTPELYVQHTVEIMREIRRVLRKDGVVFWNIGDSYYGGSPHHPGETNPGKEYYTKDVQAFGTVDKSVKHTILKSKDLCLIPFRVAIALQEDGWYFRRDIIWNKPNPMPESVKDRPTNAHEFILMLTKSKKYYWDADAVREDYSPTVRWGGGKYKGAIKQYPNSEDAGLARERSCYPNTGRNLRDVWTFPTTPFPEAHFAVFPEKLPELCIKAATSEKGCCPKCGAPWVRMVEVERKAEEQWRVRSGDASRPGPIQTTPGRAHTPENFGVCSKTIGWQPICSCGLEPIPCTVLDPFAGAGTTLLAAKKLGRQSIGYELSEKYCPMIENRIKAVMI